MQPSQESRIRPTVEGGILSAVAIVFALISAYMPLLGPFVNMIWPVPIILLGVRHGYRWSIMATCVSGLLIAVLLHPLHAIGVVVAYGLIGISLGHAFRCGYTAGKAFFLGAVASVISKIAVLLLVALIMGFNPLVAQTDSLAQAFEQAAEMYRGMGMKEEELAQIGARWQEMVEVLKLILPAGFALAALLDTYINYIVAKAVLQRMGHAVPAFPPFREWSFPLAIPYAFGFAAVGMYWGKSRELDFLYQAAVNVEMVASALLFLQGLALLFFMADRYKLSRLVRGLLVAFILLNSIFTQALILAGALEIVFDYRRLRRGKGD